MLLDGLDRVGHVTCIVQAYREGAGEPAHRAGQVDIVEQVFTPVPFELDQRRRLPGPAADHASQRGQQQVVDLGAVGRRGLLQQLPGQRVVQARVHRTGMALFQAGVRTRAWQPVGGACDLRLPVRQLLGQGRGLSQCLQAFCPVLVGRGLGRQRQRLARQALRVGLL